jgi:hypothetical protein
MLLFPLLLLALFDTSLAQPVNNQHIKQIEMTTFPTTSHVPSVTIQKAWNGHSKKALDFEIINMKTGNVEKHDPTKHFFHPEVHHPDNMISALNKYQEEARSQKLSPSQVSNGIHNLITTFEAAEMASKGTGGIIKDDYIYAPQGYHRYKASSNAKTKVLKVNQESGRLEMEKSDHEKQLEKLHNDALYQQRHSRYTRELAREIDRKRHERHHRYPSEVNMKQKEKYHRGKAALSVLNTRPLSSVYRKFKTRHEAAARSEESSTQLGQSQTSGTDFWSRIHERRS